MRRLRDLLKPFDHLKYLAWKRFGAGHSATFRLRSGERILLRNAPTSDVLTAFEMFVAEVYRPVGPEPDYSVKRIVDVGANVGLSLVYWASRYPNSTMTAFEPHRAHLRSLRQNLTLNGIAHRVTVHAAAACTAAGTVLFSDAENCSAVVKGTSAGAEPVDAVDFFAAVGSEPVDLLKMDIEGGEYALLNDERFGSLQVSRLVIEWHRTPEYPDGQQWCRQRLASLGYAVVTGKWSGDANGLLWAFRNKDATSIE